MLKSVILGITCVLLVLPNRTVSAQSVAPCTSAGTIGIIPLSNGLATYCVSDHGWSDAWFVGAAPPVYDPRLDVLSGDDAPNLHFGVLGGPSRAEFSGFGWISPIMDGGALTPTLATGSPWTVTTPVHFTAGSTTAESLVHHPAGLDMAITTTLAPAGQLITQRFAISNTTDATTFSDLLFADYFNFHPNGSTAANTLLGTVTYDPLSGITITGTDDGTLIANGSMRGERVDDFHGRNGPFLTLPIAVLDMVQTMVYFDPGGAIAVGPGDVAGGLAWELGNLAPGETTTFTIFKLADPLTADVVEPASLTLMLTGLAGLAAAAATRKIRDSVR